MLRGLVAAALIAGWTGVAQADEPDTTTAPEVRKPRPAAMAPT